MFAGAAREAVFSQAENVRRINAEFVPVALKAGLVYNPFFQNIPPKDEEGRLYREIARSMPAPQGIGVVNSAGKALAWTMAFDDDKSVLVFLDHARNRFARFPDARQPVPTERYARFPSQKGEDAADSGWNPGVISPHPKGTTCAGTPPLQRGALDARLFGRALDGDGKPVSDTVRQENYVEDRFHIDVPIQERFTKAVAEAGAERFRIEDDLARLLVSHAYLGQLDLNPAQGALKECEFWGRKVETGANVPVRIQIEGASEAAAISSRQDPRARTDGAFWQHDVKLVWQGVMEVQGSRILRLLLLGNGSEKLQWDNGLLQLKRTADVASLPAGHSIDLQCAVRYGVVGEPISAAESTEAPAGAADADPGNQTSEQVRRQLMEVLGSSFLVFRGDVQKELTLSDEQKQKMEDRFSGIVQESQKFFRDLNQARPEERERNLAAYRVQAEDRQTAFLKETLKAPQIQRLRQLELQKDGLFAIGRPEIMRELNMTDTQWQQFMALMVGMQSKIEPLFRQTQLGGNPVEMRAKIMKARKEQEDRIQALLTGDQKKQWKSLVGKPFPLEH